VIVVYMAPDQLLAAMTTLELSTYDLSDIFNIDERTIRRWVSGDSRISGPASLVLETALEYKKRKLFEPLAILLNKDRFKEGVL
jgi:DNA-binding transcriptional regulator YiaG